ncbi:hypothetical protein SH449x_003446 [Pirellulaceae bacterium SH449]
MNTRNRNLLNDFNGASRIISRIYGHSFGCISGFYLLLLLCSGLFADEFEELLDGVRSSRESLYCYSFTLVDEFHRDDQPVIQSTWHVEMILDEALFQLQSTTNPSSLGSATSIVRADEVYYYDGDSACVHGLGTGSGAFAFNPRLLGISIGPFENSTLENSLRIGRRKSGTVADSEWNGISVKSVEIDDNEGANLSFLIVPNPVFRVLKYVYEVQDLIREEWHSFYDDSIFKGVLPYRIEMHGEVFSTSTKMKRTYLISDVKEIPARKFDFIDLKMPLNTAVSDIRIRQRLGYWDGEKLAENIVTKKTSKEKESDTKTRSFGLTLPLLIAILIGLFIFAFVKRTRS